jgi:hypothetical protein
MLTGSGAATGTVRGKEVMCRATLVSHVVAMASLVGCGGSLPSPNGADPAPDAGSAVSDAAPPALDALRIDASGGQERCALEIPAPAVSGETCVYAIPSPPCDYADVSHIGIKVDGLEIPHDSLDMDGWDYTEPSLRTFEIYGPSCDALTNGSASDVTIVFRIILI